MPFTEAVEVNPKVFLEKGQEYPFVDMKAVDPLWQNASESEYRVFKSGGARFMPYDTLMARITPCLENGKISAIEAKLKAEQEYDNYRRRQDREFISDFDREIKRIKSKHKQESNDE